MLATILSTILVGPTGVRAQNVVVQSGEHADFTRLVLDIGATRTWTLSGTGSTRRLALDPPVDGFVLDRVFDLIPRTRLSAIEADEDLILTLACPCAIAAERHDGRYLLLDIAEVDPSTSEVGRPEQIATVERRAAAEMLPDMTELLLATRPLPVLDVEPRGTVLPTGEGADRADPVDMAEAARIMAEQLARAAASGLLDAAPNRPVSDADPIPDARLPTEGIDTSDANEDLGDAPTVPLRATTALDIARMTLSDPMPETNDLACAGAEIGIREWSSGEGVTHGLGALRLALHDDRDRLQPEAALMLARHYLFYGFGAEAAYWLDQIDNDPPDLEVIAALVDGRDGARFPAEADPVICSDEELLWRYLGESLEPQALTDATAGRLQRATAALPQVLRDQIAPRIARSLLRDGFPQAARNLRDMLERGGRLSDAQILALDLPLGMVATDDPETALAVDLALRDDAGDPVGAMAQAMAFDRDIDAPPNPIRLEAAEALLRENGISDVTAHLWQEVMLAQADIGDLDRMLALLAEGEDLAQATRDAGLTALIADRVAAEDTAALFLLARLHGSAWQATGSDAGRARVSAMTLLREAGLAGAAEMMRAGQRRIILPARPASAPAPAETLRDAWITSDWADVALRADGPHREVALRMDLRGGEGPGNDVSPDLPALAAQVSDSRILRDAITRLLTTPSPEVIE